MSVVPFRIVMLTRKMVSPKNKRSATFPRGQKRNRGWEKNGTPRQEKPGGIKRLQDNSEEREKGESDQEQGKKVEDETCTGKETGKGCCWGFSEEVVHPVGGRADAEGIREKGRGWGEVGVKLAREGSDGTFRKRQRDVEER